MLAFLVDRGQLDVATGRFVLGARGLGHEQIGFGVGANVFQAKAPVVAGQLVRGRQPDVNDCQSARGEVAGHCLESRSLFVPRIEQEDGIEGEHGQPEPGTAGKVEADEVPFDEVDSTAHLRLSLRRLLQLVAKPGQHGRVDVDSCDLVAGPSQRDGDPSRSGGELQDRTAGPSRQGEVQVDVAGIVEQVHVIQPRQGGSGFEIARHVGH